MHRADADAFGESASSAETESIGTQGSPLRVDDDFATDRLAEALQMDKDGRYEDHIKKGHKVVAEQGICSVAHAKQEAAQDIKKMQGYKTTKIPLLRETTLKHRPSLFKKSLNQLKLTTTIKTRAHNQTTIKTTTSMPHVDLDGNADEDLGEHLNQLQTLNLRFNPKHPVFIFNPLPLTPKSLESIPERFPLQETQFAENLNPPSVVSNGQNYQNHFITPLCGTNSTRISWFQLIIRLLISGMLCMIGWSAIVYRDQTLKLHKQLFDKSLVKLQFHAEEIAGQHLRTSEFKKYVSSQVEENFAALDIIFQQEMEILDQKAKLLEQDIIINNIALWDVFHVLNTPQKSLNNASLPLEMDNLTKISFDQVNMAYELDLKQLDDLHEELKELESRDCSIEADENQMAISEMKLPLPNIIVDLSMDDKISIFVVIVGVVLNALIFYWLRSGRLETILEASISFIYVCGNIVPSSSNMTSILPELSHLNPFSSTILGSITSCVSNGLHYLFFGDSTIPDIDLNDDIIFIPQSPIRKKKRVPQ